VDWGDFARGKATEIYNLSLACLMAHSIRAAEKQIQLGGRDYAVRLHVRTKFAQKAGSRARAYIQDHRADIMVDADLGREYQRLAIAHEIGHILIALEQVNRNGRLDAPVTEEIEGACKLFEKALCKQHDGFYADAKNIAACRFHTLHD